MYAYAWAHRDLLHSLSRPLFRAAAPYNDGRYLDTELKVPDHGFEWGYKPGPVDMRFVMHLSDAGEWVETGDVKFGDNPPQRTFDMTLRKQK